MAGLLLAGGLVPAAWWWRRPAPVHDDALEAARASPWLNARPGVTYIGDDACADCHASHAASYRLHPMGRSLVPIGQDPPLETFEAKANNPFERLGTRFSVESPPGGMLYCAQRLDAQGKVLVQTRDPIHYALGSGTRGRAYLINHDGHLFQSAISWFSQKSSWDLSPGFEALYPRQRVVQVACLFCHANQVEPVPGTRGHYREPLFRGHAIGCERCHGPGALHVAARQAGELPQGDVDRTIVNPRHLDPVLREAVCQQCHLQGEERFERRGRDTFDYRPGLPLHLFWAVFVKAPDLADQKAVGQVEQTAASRCAQASAGKLGCISCHDPHVLPDAAHAVSYYRDRCLACHQQHGCSLPLIERQKRQPNDSCAACHMPRLPSADIVHTALTDHRILRNPSGPEQPRREPLFGEIDFVNFFAKELEAQDPAVARDLGVALLYQSRHMGPSWQQYVSQGLPLVEQALRVAPDDPVARELFGWGRGLQGRNEEAFKEYEAVLAREPNREVTLILAQGQAETLGRKETALTYTRRLAALNPWLWEYQLNLARLLAQRDDWTGAFAASEAALKLLPADTDTRVLFVLCCLRLRKTEQAKSEFDTLLALNPRDEKKLRDWFAAQR